MEPSRWAALTKTTIEYLIGVYAYTTVDRLVMDEKKQIMKMRWKQTLGTHGGSVTHHREPFCIGFQNGGRHLQSLLLSLR